MDLDRGWEPKQKQQRWACLHQGCWPPASNYVVENHLPWRKWNSSALFLKLVHTFTQESKNPVWWAQNLLSRACFFPSPSETWEGVTFAVILQCMQRRSYLRWRVVTVIIALLLLGTPWCTAEWNSQVLSQRCAKRAGLPSLVTQAWNTKWIEDKVTGWDESYLAKCFNGGFFFLRQVSFCYQ